MSSAAPMVARCLAAQWRGLTDSERARLSAAWDRQPLPGTWWLRAAGIESVETPIWAVSHLAGPVLYLVSVKDEWLADVPTNAQMPVTGMAR